MELEAISLRAGRAGGPVHLMPGAGDRGPTPPPGSVWVVPGPGFPSAGEVRSPEAVIFGDPESSPTPTPTVPSVTGLPSDLFREGERVEVDGDRGRVTVADLRPVEVVSVFLQRDDGRILLLRRSERVGSFRGHWAGVSGFLEDPTPELQAFREVREETGLDREDLTLESTGRTVYARDGATVYVVHPFRARVHRTDIRIDWEHTAAEWVDPAEIGRRPTVPHLDRTWDAVAPRAVRKG